MKINQPFGIPSEYTIIARPSDEIVDKIGKFIDSLEEIDPTPYFYNKSELHLTFFGTLPVNLEKEKFCKFAMSQIKTIPSFEVKGISNSTIMLTPINFSLGDFREAVNNYLGINNYSNYSKAMLETPWINILRFRQEPKDQLIKFFERNRMLDFGLLKIDTLYMCKTDRRVIRFPYRDAIKIHLG